jgi:pimeloyl-ACP methyl ester carboxylesterase
MKTGISRRGLLSAGARAGVAGAAIAALGGAGATLAASAPKRTWLVCHGAWSAGWAWKKMRPLLSEGGSTIWTPTYTGLGERAHLASAQVTVDTHVQDIVAVLEMEDLRDVTLIAHSYGGIVGTGVAGRARTRIRQLIYVDAFVPRSGQSLQDIAGKFDVQPDGLVAPRPTPQDTPADDLAWIAARRLPQPANTLTTPVRFDESNLPPRAYVRALRLAPGDPLKSSFDRARAERWPLREIDTSHNPHITAPALLLQTLQQLAV